MHIEKLSEQITIVLGDSREVDASLCDGIICDPPYGISHPCNFASRNRDNLAKCNDWSNVVGDTEPFEPEWLLNMNKPTVLWGGNWFADRLPPSGGWLVWDKERPDTLDQSTCELAWTNCIKGVRRYRHLWDGMRKASEHRESYHPTQKPVALFAWILSLRWMGDVSFVFDPYMGSAPCGIACVRAGRKYLGVEINEQHFETAKMRLQKEIAQGQIYML